MPRITAAATKTPSAATDSGENPGPVSTLRRPASPWRQAHRTKAPAVHQSAPQTIIGPAEMAPNTLKTSRPTVQPVQKTTAVPRKPAIPLACLSPSRAIQYDPESKSPLETRPSNQIGMVFPIKFNLQGAPQQASKAV